MPESIFDHLEPTTTQEQFKAKYNDFFQDYYIRNQKKVDDFLLYFLNFCFNYYVNNCFLKFTEDIVGFIEFFGLPFAFTFETNEQLMDQKESEQRFKELLSENSLLDIFELLEIENLIKTKILPIIRTRLNLIQGPLKRKYLDFVKEFPKDDPLDENSLAVQYKKFFDISFIRLKKYLKTNLTNNFASFLILFIEYAAKCFQKRNLLLANLATSFETVANNYLENFNPQVINENLGWELLQVMTEINQLTQQFCEETDEFIAEKMKDFEEELKSITASLEFEDDEECIR